VSYVTVVLKRHALAGQKLRVVSLRSSRGPAFVLVALRDGRHRSIRRSITDLATEPFRNLRDSIEEGHQVSVRTLLALARYLAARRASIEATAVTQLLEPMPGADVLVVGRDHRSACAEAVAESSGRREESSRADSRGHGPQGEDDAREAG
jgi:hypothetical protein